MVQRVVYSHRFQLPHGLVAEGTSTCREDYFGYVVPVLTCETLEYSGVFAVYGYYSRIRVFEKRCDYFSSHYKSLLVGKSDGLACHYRVDGRYESAVSHHCCDHDVGFRHRGGFLYGGGATLHPDGGSGKGVPEIRQEFLACNHDAKRIEPACLGGEQFPVVRCCKHCCAEFFGMLFDYVKGLGSDGTSRS